MPVHAAKYQSVHLLRCLNHRRLTSGRRSCSPRSLCRNQLRSNSRWVNPYPLAACAFLPRPYSVFSHLPVDFMVCLELAGDG